MNEKVLPILFCIRQSMRIQFSCDDLLRKHSFIFDVLTDFIHMCMFLIHNKSKQNMWICESYD